MLMAFIFSCNQRSIKIGKKEVPRQRARRLKPQRAQLSLPCRVTRADFAFPLGRDGDAYGVLPAGEAHPSRLHSQQAGMSASPLHTPGSF